MITDDAQFIESWLTWGKGSLKTQLAQFRAGDTRELVLVPVIPSLSSGTGRTITKAWLVFKSPETASDPTENAAWTSTGGLISISTTETAGRGWIVNANESSAELRFYLTNINTAALMRHKSYTWAVQVKMSDGALYEVDSGRVDVLPQFITATS